MKENKISIVIPAYNEAANLRELLPRIQELCHSHDWHYQIIIINDGSSDGSDTLLDNFAGQDSRIQVINFRHNLGKATALDAGFRAVSSDTVITMDADQQDRPEEIPVLIAKLNEGFDLVCGWRVNRQDSLFKIYPSIVYNKLLSWLFYLKLHDHNCGLKAYRRKLVDDLRLYGDMHRFIPIIANSKGYKVTEVAVSHSPRKYGQSKYNSSRFLKCLLDMFSIKFLKREI